MNSPEDLARAVEAAIALSVKFHAGQRDKAGVAYILHPLTLLSKTTDPLVQQAAVLHDILEDTDATVMDLTAAGIHPDAIEAIQLLTHDPQKTYAEYVVRLKENAIAKKAKLLDLYDNYRLDRVAYREEHSQEDGRRLQKYILTKQYLSDEIDEPTYRRRMVTAESV
jgi:hypothetical protein